MQVYKQLVKTFLSSTDVDSPRQKNQKLFYAILGFISVCFIMIPCCLLVGYLSYALALGLNGSGVGVTFLTHFIALFSVAFGISVILNVFYFSGDLPMVLPLPIPPYKLIAAKFTAAYVSESVMQFMILIAIFVGYMIGAGFGVMPIIAGVIGFITIPVAPLTYCGILCIILMGLTKWIRNKEHVRRLGMIFALFIVVAALSMVGLLKDVDFNGFAESLASGGVAFMNVMNVVFVGNFLLGKALEGSIISLLLYLLYHLFIVSLFLVIADKLYIKGVVGILSGGDGASKKRSVKGMKLRTPIKSYLVKEFRTLFRTPAFFLNCVVVNLLWPLLIYVVYVMNKESSAFDKFWVLYQTGNEGVRWVVVLAVFGLSVLLTAMNSLGSSAITREGKYYYAMKYLPISYKKQLHMKALVSIIISSVFVFAYIIALSIVLNVDNAVSWYYLLLSFMEIVFTTYFGLYLDTINPRLNWDDELNALRGNTNVFFNMAYAILIAGAFAGVAYALYRFTNIPLVAMEMVLLVVALVGDVFMVNLCIKKGSENIKEMY